jgi:hypothetical protein
MAESTPSLVQPPFTTGPGLRPALIVVGIALFLVIGGSIVAGLSGSTAPSPAPQSVKTATGSPLPAVPARTVLAPIVSDGQPPDDILNSVVLPEKAIAGATTNNTDNLIGYDRSMSFTLAANDTNLIAFYKAELPAEGWKITSTGAPHGESGYEILAEQAGNDGNEWDLGVIIAPTTFSAGGPASGTSKFTLTFEVASDDG